MSKIELVLTATALAMVTSAAILGLVVWSMLL